jgi:integrase/recombinase XerD
MLNLWRRHLRSCPHSKKKSPRKWKNCQCPIWVQGNLHGKWLKKALTVRSWESAQKIVRAWEAGERAVTVTVKDACKRWLADCEARNLKHGSFRKYRHLARELEERFGDLPVSSVSVDDVRRMRESWDLSGTTTAKRLELARAFFSFCVASGWSPGNPAKMVRAPQAVQTPTMPFSKEEFEKILWALEVYCEKHPQSPPDTQRKLRAMILLMRYSGIRISDAVMLKNDRIKDGRLFLYQAKTGVPVYIPLPKEVRDALSACEEPSGRCFWPGGASKTWTTEWQARMKKVFVIAGIPDGHPHRLRDTFSVELLEKGVPLETVSLLLGHKSIRTTEKHYAPWVHARQTALEKAVMKTWKSAQYGISRKR